MFGIFQYAYKFLLLLVGTLNKNSCEAFWDGLLQSYVKLKQLILKSLRVWKITIRETLKFVRQTCDCLLNSIVKLSIFPEFCANICDFLIFRPIHTSRKITTRFLYHFSYFEWEERVSAFASPDDYEVEGFITFIALLLVPTYSNCCLLLLYNLVVIINSESLCGPNIWKFARTRIQYYRSYKNIYFVFYLYKTVNK